MKGVFLGVEMARNTFARAMLRSDPNVKQHS